MEENEASIEKYTQQVAKKSLDPKPYDRLMIYYRQHKKFRDELRVLDKAIALFSAKLGHNKKQPAIVMRLSRMIGKSVGLMDKSGNQLHLPGPIQKWKRRRSLVLSKLEVNKKKAQKKR